MKVRVLTISGEQVEVSLTGNETIQQFKNILAQKCQAAVENVRLLFSGVNMTEQPRPLTSYGVVDGSTIHMHEQDNVTLHVRSQDGASQRITAEPNEPIQALRERLAQRLGHNADNIELLHGNTPIQGRLSHHGIEDGAELQMRLQNPNITVRTPDGRGIPMDTSQVQNVTQLQENLHQQTGIPPSQQRLIHEGRPLNPPGGGLSNLSSGSTIQMQGMTRGG